MTIQVVSNSVAEPVSAAAAPVETKSAPVAQAAEQNESAASEATETEEEEETDASTESKSDEGDGKEDGSEKDKPKKKGGFQRRIDKLNAAKAKAEQELEYWKGVATKKEATEPKHELKVEAKSATTGKPDPENFETHAEYVEALTGWTVDQRAKDAELKQQRSALQTEQEKLVQAYSERVKSFSEKTKDFDDVLGEVDDVVISPTVREIIVSSENGPELAYELAKNRVEFERINKLHPLAAARELGHIETKLALQSSDTKKPETKKLTQAPTPLNPVGSKGGSVQKDPEKMTQPEYEAHRREQMKRRSSSWG